MAPCQREAALSGDFGKGPIISCDTANTVRHLGLLRCQRREVDTRGSRPAPINEDFSEMDAESADRDSTTSSLLGSLERGFSVIAALLKAPAAGHSLRTAHRTNGAQFLELFTSFHHGVRYCDHLEKSTDSAS